MFKFARYFFLAFIITTVIPLVSMFLWTHNQMEKMEQERAQHFLEIGINQLKVSSEQNLKLQENSILRKIQDLSTDKPSLKYLQNIFEPAQVEQIKKKSLDKIQSHYEVTRNGINGRKELSSVSIVPIKGQEFKIINRIRPEDLRPVGPFEVEIYSGTQINKNSLIEVIKDPLFQPMHQPPLMPPLLIANNNNFIPLPPPHHPEMEFADFQRRHMTKSDKMELTNNNGNIIATLVLKTFQPLGHFPPKKPFENEFGIIILFAGSLLSLCLGFYIKRNFIQPLFLLSDASRKIQKGDLSFRLNTNIKQEQILSTFDNFNKMINGLKEKEELRKSFITSLTHDLRTPLIAQERSLELISKEFEKLGLEDAYELAVGIEKNNQHLLRMVNLILESYRFDSDNLKFIVSQFSLSELIDGCFEKLKPLAQAKHIELLNNVPNDFPPMNGDLTSYKRIFLNLISNAIDNINQNGKVKIQVETDENFIKIYIEDNGPGISADDIDYIFDRYYTGKSDERKIGSGLGLYVCKKLVEKHNGEISVESEMNNYTKFIIKIPKL